MKKNYKKGESYKKYDLTLEEYNSLKEKSGNLCYICSAPPKKKNLCIDHNHTVAKQLKKQKLPISKSVRGLLCWTCNSRLISNLGDRKNAVLLYTNAAKYLKDYNASQG